MASSVLSPVGPASALSGGVPVYIIHDDRDRGLVELLTRRLALQGFGAWGRGQRRPGNAGAEQLLTRARIAVLVITNTTTESQLVHVDLTRAARQGLPLARLIIERGASSYAAEYPYSAGGVTAYAGLTDAVIEELAGLIADKARSGAVKGFVQRLLPRAYDQASGRASGRASGPARADGDVPETAATLGRRMTLTRIVPPLLIMAAVIGASGYYWLQARSRQAEQVQRSRPRLAEPVPVPSARAQAAQAVQSLGAATLSLPPGIQRAGYEAPAPATATQVAQGAQLLKIIRINRSAFRLSRGVRLCDLEVLVENPTTAALPVVALSIGVRDSAGLNGSDRLIQIDRQWVAAGSSQSISSTLADLPAWATEIIVAISPTRS